MASLSGSISSSVGRLTYAVDDTGPAMVRRRWMLRSISANLLSVEKDKDAIPIRVRWLLGGWVHAVAEGVAADIYVRLLPDDSGRYRVREFYVDAADEAGGPLTSDALRRLPLAELEALTNLSGDEFGQLSRNFPCGGRLRVLASHLGRVPNRARRLDSSREELSWAETAMQDWVAASYLATLDEHVRRDRGLDAMRPPEKIERRKRSSGGNRGQADAAFRLTSGPSGGRLDEDFMRDLARAYRAAIARGESPNKAIARDSGYERRTVESWVYRARRRGFLPPARKGAAG